VSSEVSAESVSSEDEIYEGTCHESCLSCSGPNDTDCDQCDASKNKKIKYSNASNCKVTDTGRLHSADETWVKYINHSF